MHPYLKNSNSPMILIMIAFMINQIVSSVLPKETPITKLLATLSFSLIATIMTVFLINVLKKRKSKIVVPCAVSILKEKPLLEKITNEDSPKEKNAEESPKENAKKEPESFKEKTVEEVILLLTKLGYTIKANDIKGKNAIILTGTPGIGKSTISNILKELFIGLKVVVVNQDTTKGNTQAFMLDALEKGADIIVLDRCNQDREALDPYLNMLRKYKFKIAFFGPKDVDVSILNFFGMCGYVLRTEESILNSRKVLLSGKITPLSEAFQAIQLAAHKFLNTYYGYGMMFQSAKYSIVDLDNLKFMNMYRQWNAQSGVVAQLNFLNKNRNHLKDCRNPIEDVLKEIMTLVKDIFIHGSHEDCLYDMKPVEEEIVRTTISTNGNTDYMKKLMKDPQVRQMVQGLGLKPRGTPTACVFDKELLPDPKFADNFKGETSAKIINMITLNNGMILIVAKTNEIEFIIPFVAPPGTIIPANYEYDVSGMTVKDLSNLDINLKMVETHVTKYKDTNYPLMAVDRANM